jgi:hypothetical protein
MTYNIEHFELEFIGKGVKSNFNLIPVNDCELLSLKNELRKIYVIRSVSNQYFYVGEAATSIKTRFQRGFGAFRYKVRNGKGRNGYSGYKWIEPGQELHKLRVDVIVFLKEDLTRTFVEAVEGELVYLIRNETGEWPLYQNEIHFWSENDSLNSKVFAEEIFSIIKRHQ